MTSDLTRAIDELYGVPPKEFAGARNAKAAALKAAGRTADADAVRRLAKPSPFLWATNQLARLDPDRVARFADVVHRMRQSQLRDPRTTAEGMQTIRAELQALTSRAGEALARAGYRVAASATARISNTVLGAAVDAALVDDLRRGRLAAELPAPGFEALAGVAPSRTLQLVRGGKTAARAETVERPPARAEAARPPEHVARADAPAERARVRAERARPQAERAQADREREQAERARRAAEAAARRREAERRAAEAARAGDEVRELARQLAEARRKLRAAQREAAAAAARARRDTDA